MDLLGSALFFTNSPTPSTPVCVSKWDLLVWPFRNRGLLTFQRHRHNTIRDFGAVTFIYWFRLECFAVYASSPLLPPKTQDSLCSGLANLLQWDFHPQDQCSFAQRTGRTPKSVRSKLCFFMKLIATGFFMHQLAWTKIALWLKRAHILFS
jgi:hypothetical protein